MSNKKRIKKKMLPYLLSYFFIVIIASLLLIAAFHWTPVYSNNNTKETIGVVSDIRKESYLTGYRTRSRIRIVVTLENGAEYHIPYTIMIDYTGKDYDSLCESILGKEVVIRYHNDLNLRIVKLDVHGQEYLSYQISNRASQSTRIGAIVVYSIVLLLSGVYLGLKFSLKH